MYIEYRIYDTTSNLKEAKELSDSIFNKYSATKVTPEFDSAKPVFSVIIIKNKESIGYIDLRNKIEDKFNGNVEVDVGILPEYRNKGYGKMLVAKLLEEVKVFQEIKKIYWTYKNTNLASKTLAEISGFKNKIDLDENQTQLIFKNNY